jgi:hypothetical protein
MKNGTTANQSEKKLKHVLKNEKGLKVRKFGELF